MYAILYHCDNNFRCTYVHLGMGGGKTRYLNFTCYTSTLIHAHGRGGGVGESDRGSCLTGGGRYLSHLVKRSQ